MRRNFQQAEAHLPPAQIDSAALDLPPIAARRTSRSRGPIGSYDAFLRRFCDGDRALLTILRLASVPLAFGLAVLIVLIVWSFFA